MFFSISANLCDKVSISWLIFWAVIFAYSWVVFILVCPNRRLTVSIGTPLDKRTVVAFVCLATWKEISNTSNGNEKKLKRNQLVISHFSILFHLRKKQESGDY